MKTKTCNTFSRCGIAFVFATAFCQISPVLAATPAATAPAQVPEEIIPTASAVVVGFPHTVTFKAEQGSVYPETGVLLQPLFDNNQQSVVPAGTPVMAQLYPSAQGVTIEAHSLVFGGKVVSIQASGSLIPSTAVSVSGGLGQMNLSQMDAKTPYILTLGTEIPLNGHGAPLF